MELLFGTAQLIAWGGVFIIAFLLFAETGFLLGLIVPGGETLIFTAGILASADTFNMGELPLFGLLVGAAFLGDASGYFIGKKLGPRLYHKKDTWYFQKRFLQGAERYFRAHRAMAVLLGKFLPIVRPFMPVLGGITGLRPAVFFPLSLAAVALHVSVFFWGGFFLGGRFPGIKDQLGWILPISLVIILVPALIQIRKNRAGKA